MGRASLALSVVRAATLAGWSCAFSAAATAMDARIKLAAITTARKSNNIVAVLHWYRERPTAQKVQGANSLALFCVLEHSSREGDQRMKIKTVAFALGTAVVLCSLVTSGAEARARKAVVVRAPQERLIVTAPVLRPTPWDYNVVPRYRYRPEDDRVDPYGPPIVPSYVRYEGWRWPYWW